MGWHSDRATLLTMPTTNKTRCALTLVYLDSQDGELDAILKELCALGSQLEQEIKVDDPPRSANTRSSGKCCLFGTNPTFVLGLASVSKSCCLLSDFIVLYNQQGQWTHWGKLLVIMATIKTNTRPRRPMRGPTRADAMGIKWESI